MAAVSPTAIGTASAKKSARSARTASSGLLDTMAELAPLRVRSAQQRGDAGVGGGLDAAVGGVVGVVFRQQRLKQRAVRSGRDGQLHQPPGPIAERGAHLLPRALRQAVAGERAVHGRRSSRRACRATCRRGQKVRMCSA